MKTSVVVRFTRDRDGRRVAYAMHGRGPTLVCLAWWVSHLEKDWDQPDFRAFFERLGVMGSGSPSSHSSSACSGTFSAIQGRS